MDPGTSDGNRTGDGASGAEEAPLVRVVWGTATGPTALSAYDAALAGAGVENYNLVRVSSIVPAEATVAPVGTAPDLGPAGNRLTVVEARATVGGDPGGSATDGQPGTDVGAAGLAWATGPGPGLFYEVAGSFGEAECRRQLDAGLEAGQGLREWTFDESHERVASVDVPGEGFASAVVLGVYGESEPIF